MLAAFSKELSQKIGGAIEYLRVTSKSFRAMHVPFNADYLLDFIQITGGSFELSDGI